MPLTPNESLNDTLAIFASAMTAVATRLVRATAKPSKTVITGEILIGLAFCFFLAPAVQEYYGLSVKAICAMTWAGSYFSGLLLAASEKILLGYVKKFTPKNDDSE